MDAATLRATFREFADAATYPDASINFWLSIGVKLLREEVWDDMRDHALALFVAHNLVLEQRNVEAAALGGTPGVGGGAIASKSVGPVSVSYDTSATLLENGGMWNATQYGIRLLQLARIFGAGGMQL